jgi:SagB-type dehydrogenase family enzyme
LSQSFFLLFGDGVSGSLVCDGEFVVESDSRRITFKRVGPGTTRALQRLAVSGGQEDELVECVRQLDGNGALPKFYHYLDRLTFHRLLLRSVRNGTQPFATLAPVSNRFVFPYRDAADGQRYTLSRFCYIRREGRQLVLESPLSHARVMLHDWRAVALVHGMVEPRTVQDLGTSITDVAPCAAASAVALLLNGGMLEEVSSEGRTQEDDNRVMQSWEFHDLLFHSRTRAGINDGGIASTYKLGDLNLPPALKPPGAGDTVDLFRPDLEKLEREDPPFARVHEARCSLREYGGKPITARQLGEFLYRVARVRTCRDVTVATPYGGVPLSIATRPYPSGGALYELEVYAAVNNCQDLERGLYYYEPLDHRLCGISDRQPDAAELISEAAVSAQIPSGDIQILLILAARFPRVAWKYAGLTYSLVLKNVGVVYQSMYLTATAMDLAPCALGCGNAELFARAAGTDCYVETSVGEFLLGSKA